MDRERFRKVDELLDGALDRPRDERSRWLAERTFTGTVALLILCGGFSSPLATAQDCPVVESVIPEFPDILRLFQEMVEPGSTTEIAMALSVDPLGRPTAVAFPEGLKWLFLREAFSTTALQWRFEPSDTDPPLRTIRLTFRFRTVRWYAPPADLEPKVEGCSVEVRAQASIGRFRPLTEIPREYRFLYDRSIHDKEAEQKARASLPCDSISLERIPPSTLVFYKDGRARFDGGRYAARQGSYEGEVSIWDYGRLCYALEALGFFKMGSHYISGVNSHARSFVLKVTASTGDKEVSDTDNQGPPELWALAQAVDGVAAQIHWKRVKGPRN